MANGFAGAKDGRAKIRKVELIATVETKRTCVPKKQPIMMALRSPRKAYVGMTSTTSAWHPD